LRADGTVKVLDFGLAKLLDTDAPGRSSGAGGFDASASPTITTPAMTISGVILGTAAYMSPEQAKGRPADKRSDIWAFGCVLYELLTGKRAFEGEDVSDTLAAVLRGEPEWKSLRPTTPPAITQLLRRCLERDPRRRLHDIADARIELEDIRATGAASHDAEHGIADGLKLRWAIPLVLTSLVIGAAGGAPKAVTTLDSAKGETAHHWPGMLPDGKTVLYGAGPAGSGWDDTEIVAQSLQTGQRRTLHRGGAFPRYVPTGHLVYANAGNLFAAPFDVKRLTLAGDPVSIVDGVLVNGEEIGTGESALGVAAGTRRGCHRVPKKVAELLGIPLRPFAADETE
jgi:Protein kinase domain